MLERGIYVIGFSFPVVPKGQARIRTQMSAAHSAADIDRRGCRRSARSGRELGVISGIDVQHDARAGEGQGRARHLDGTGAGAGDRPERRADQGQEDRDLRHRRAYLQLGPVGAEDRAGADGDRPRIRRHGRRFRRGRDRIQGRPARLGRGAYRLRPLPQLPRGQGASLPQHARRRRQPARRLRRISRHPAAQCRADPRRHAGRDRRDLRSARQCRAHRAVLRSRRRGRAGHRRRADRHHGRAGGAVRRRAQGRHHRHQPGAAGAGQEARRPSRRRCVEGEAARRDARRSA